MSEKPQWVKTLEAQACTCTRCSECRGNGYKTFGWDDMSDDDEDSNCYMCRGSGITEECERCMDLRDWDEEAAQ